MRRVWPGLLVAWATVCGALLLPSGFSQEKEDRTLLSWAQMRAIIDEASGERAQQIILEMVPYPRVRPRTEYQGNFRESEVMARYAREAGFSSVEIESFPAPGRLWQPSAGQLWMVEPEQRKLYDIYEVAISLCANSAPGDVTAELVEVGVGSRAEDYAGKDVAGKIVLGSAGAGALQRLAVFERGAAGIVSYNSLRPDSYPDQILSAGISANAPQGRQPGFGWCIAPRVGRELADRLRRGEKVVLRSVVQAETFPGETEVVHAMIPGDGSSNQAIMISAHLYEGYIKQGANDDNSGCAATLEMGRTLLRLLEQGKLPRPRRDIHFLWVPEFSGTIAWLRRHEEVQKRLIADLNFDMEGLGLRMSSSFWTLHRTPDTFPSFLSDVCASVMEFIANLNRERVRYRHHGYRFTLPVVSPNGSQDPFYIAIEKHYGASDHVVYLNQGIPAVIFVTWPDMWYHSSHDTPDKLDPTQFKRVAVVGTACMIALAAADDAMAWRIVAESLARGAERQGEAHRKGLAYLADVADRAGLRDAYREARVAVRHQTNVEKGVVRSAAVLFNAPPEAEKKLAGLEVLVEQRGSALENEVRAFYQALAERHKVVPEEIVLTAEQEQASRLVVERIAPAPGPGGPPAAQPPQQPSQPPAPPLTPEERAAAQAALRKIPQHMTSELNILLGRKKTALEIRDFLSGEFEPLPLADLMDYLRAQEKLGVVKLTEKPEEPPPAPAKKGKAPRKKSGE